MKKSCNGCKAFDSTSNGRCKLGYKLKREYFNDIIIKYKPTEECEKTIIYGSIYFHIQRKTKELNKGVI